MQSLDRPRRALAIALAALAGFVDAAGYLSADRYFVSFMSGNTTRFGVDLVTRPQAALVPLILIGGFVAGVVAGALLAHQSGARRKTAVLMLVALFLLGAATLRELGYSTAMLGLLVLSMGALNNSFQRNGEVAIGLTYMTGALVRMGQGIAARITRSGGEAWAEWLQLWLGLASGAVLGAWAWYRMPGAVLWLPAGWAGLLAALSLRLPRSVP